ncbi:MAG TPA: acyl-CoA dehydrogenase family protein [Candidatus Marinimicrobia bacterium]|nr:acyl-CoA dehydrogenase family protein [Candidatus Neomarinimicrobiota bacterium]|tara:strand:+ start:820 stop:1962 length:1143 start_codon:yes stop_codon:yes gene_type:complete
MKKENLTEEQMIFQDAVRTFFERECKPHYEQWEKDGMVSRDIWLKAGENNFFGIDVPEEYGGMGIDDFRYNTILIEEGVRSENTGFGHSVQNDLVVPYLIRHCNEEQKKRWLPKICSGEAIGALAMTEPSGGSDLAAIKTTAKDMGDHYIVNGSKTFITNGILSDFVIVACKTDSKNGAHGISLIVLERGMEGFERGNKLHKIGQRAQDTAEMFFKDVKVPKENLLGEEGKGFYYMMESLPKERLSIAAGSIAVIEFVLEMTIQYCHERKAFGQKIGSFQNSKFKLAEMATEAEIARTFYDQCVFELNDKKLTPEKAAMAKWWITELELKVVDQCLQLHGGYGYILEYPIAKAYINSRVQTIYGGTTEIMKEIIGKSLGF